MRKTTTWACALIVPVAFGLFVIHAAIGQGPDPVLQVQLEKDIYFSGVDDPVLRGGYGVDYSHWGHLTLTPDQGEPVMVPVVFGNHDEDISQPEVLPAETGQDEFHLMVLLPGGTALDAAASYSGIETRGSRVGRLALSNTRITEYFREKRVYVMPSQTLAQQKQPSIVAVQQPSDQGPDLVITSYTGDGSYAYPDAGVKVKNVGNAPAVFTESGPLVSYFGGQVDGAFVPAGGTIQPGQTITLLNGLGHHWYCPGPMDDLQYAFFNISWNYALARPTGPQGFSRSALLVDPDNRVQEANEFNNKYVVKRANPHKTVIQGSGNPDLVVSSVTESAYVASANGRYLNIRVKNIGSRTTYSCGPNYSNSDQSAGAELLRGYVDGSDRFVSRGHTSANSIMTWKGSFYRPIALQPGQELEHGFFLSDAAQIGQYGVWTDGLQPGCHEVRLVVNPQGHFEADRACNNETFYYLSSGGVSCGANQTMRTSSCN